MVDYLEASGSLETETVTFNFRNIMKFSNYKLAKAHLRGYAKWVKFFYGNDKPAIREAINIKTHEQSKEWDLTEYKTNLLHNYACTLHPKD